MDGASDVRAAVVHALRLQDALLGALDSGGGDDDDADAKADAKAHTHVPQAYGAATCETRMHCGVLVKVYLPSVFGAVAHTYGGSGVVAESFASVASGDVGVGVGVGVGSETLTLDTGSGRSGARFAFTDDGLYVLKTLTRDEKSTLLRVAPAYARHVLGGGDNDGSLLSRFVALFRVKWRGGGVTYAAVMNNVVTRLCGQCDGTLRLYDLKGSVVHRRAAASERVWKELNVDFAVRMPAATHAAVLAAVERDAAWLAAHNLMDYSLLLAVARRVCTCARRASSGGRAFAAELVYDDDGTGDLPCTVQLGCIDFLQEYNRTKRATTALKRLRHERADISTVPPAFYAARFVGWLRAHMVAGSLVGLPAELASAAAMHGDSAGAPTVHGRTHKRRNKKESKKRKKRGKAKAKNNGNVSAGGGGGGGTATHSGSVAPSDDSIKSEHVAQAAAVDKTCVVAVERHHENDKARYMRRKEERRRAAAADRHALA